MTHQAEDDAQARSIFVHHLNRLYFGKRYLEKKMDDLVESASLRNLQLALTEMWQDVKHQICRMEEIYQLIDESPVDEANNPIKSIVKDNFCLDQTQTILMLKDIDIILYVQLLEHINITSYRMLKMLAHTLQN